MAYKHIDFACTVLEASIGQRMWQAKAERKTLPGIIKICHKDTKQEKAMKQLILDMTKYDPDSRPSMDEVELQLTMLIGNSYYHPICFIVLACL